MAAWEHWDFPECGETGSESLLGQAGPPAAQYLPRAESRSAGSWGRGVLQSEKLRVQNVFSNGWQGFLSSAIMKGAGQSCSGEWVPIWYRLYL